MEVLEQQLNGDVVYYIKQHAIKEMKQDADALLEYFNERVAAPVEPSGGKNYNVWLQYMMHYTKTIKPVENEFRNLHSKISESKDFDEIQLLYPQLKDTLDKWYGLKKRYQFSGYYSYV